MCVTAGICETLFGCICAVIDIYGDGLGEGVHPFGFRLGFRCVRSVNQSERCSASTAGASWRYLGRSVVG